MNEIIKYNAISSDGKTLTVATSGRGASGTTDVTHASGSVVECYNLDGIPLIDINKTHTSLECPWMDTYMLQMTGVAKMVFAQVAIKSLHHRILSLKLSHQLFLS